MSRSKSASSSCHSSTHRIKQNQIKPSESSLSAVNQRDSIVPLANGHSHAMVAKTLAKENLLHQPLPDNFNDHVHKLCDDNGCKDTTAVGCKCYGVPGPTQCSKLKVYRPKTAHELQGESARRTCRDHRQMDCVKADKKELYSDIDYALCWDLCPPGHKEHQKTPHQDDRTESLASAVFSLVPSRDPSPCLYEPKRDGLGHQQPRVLSSKCCSKTNQDEKRVGKEKQWIETTTPVNPSAVMTIVKKSDSKENFFTSIQPTEQKTRCSSCSSHRSLKARKKQDPGLKPWSSEQYMGPNKGDYKRLLDRREMQQRLKQRNIHSSSPILTENRLKNVNGNGLKYNDHDQIRKVEKNNHNCEKCTNQNDQYDTNGRENECDYPIQIEHHKNGTKGNNESRCPNLCRSHGSSASSNPRKNGSSTSKVKSHYVKKNYSIPTLLPPFTLWPGTTGQDYPGHWRLVSVYQHSYRPIEMRKRSLLKCVYQ